jgi:hypothetical protein
VYINTIDSSLIGVKQFLRGIAKKAKTKTTTFGEYRGVHIAIDNFKDSDGNILQKRYVFWSEDTQLVWYKNKNSKGKFEILG